MQHNPTHDNEISNTNCVELWRIKSQGWTLKVCWILNIYYFGSKEIDTLENSEELKTNKYARHLNITKVLVPSKWCRFWKGPLKSSWDIVTSWRFDELHEPIQQLTCSFPSRPTCWYSLLHYNMAWCSYSLDGTLRGGLLEHID